MHKFADVLDCTHNTQESQVFSRPWKVWSIKVWGKWSRTIYFCAFRGRTTNVPWEGVCSIGSPGFHVQCGEKLQAGKIDPRWKDSDPFISCARQGSTGLPPTSWKLTMNIFIEGTELCIWCFHFTGCSKNNGHSLDHMYNSFQKVCARFPVSTS